MAEIAHHYPAGRATGVTASVYPILFPVPVVLFLAAVATDISYASSAYLMWLHFSQWLVAAGLAVGALAALVLLIEFIASRAARLRIGWVHLALFYAALVVELFNALVHTIDGWTAVVPKGMALSIVGALLALAAGAAMRHRRVHRFDGMEERP